MKARGNKSRMSKRAREIVARTRRARAQLDALIGSDLVVETPPNTPDANCEDE